MTPIRLYGNVRMMADPPALIIGASAADHLLLRPTRRTYPDLPDYWDGELRHRTSARAVRPGGTDEL